MILDEIILHDFGTYGGRQNITLTPDSPDRPIILFGGLNGGGKTTLLDALQLCFSGMLRSAPDAETCHTMSICDGLCTAEQFHEKRR